MAPLLPSTALRSSIVPGTTTGHDNDHLALHAWYDRGDLIPVWSVQDPAYGALGDGSTNDTAAIAAAIAACPAGGIVYFPNGNYVTDPISITKCVHVVGEGRWTTWLTPRTAISVALLQFNLPSPSGPVRNMYGPSLTGIGIDLYAAPAATGLLVNANTNWMVTKDFYCQGGAVSIDHRGPNCRYEQVRLVDAGKFMQVDGETGLELTLKDWDCTRGINGTTSVGIEIIRTTGGVGGDVRLDNVAINSGGGAQVLSAGILISSTALNLSIPVFANDVVVDNCAGVSLRIVNCRDQSWDQIWCNSAAGATAAVQIAGGGAIRFDDSTFFGGSGGAGTFEFTGTNACTGFVSTKNYCPSGPVYRVTGARPTDHFLDDWCPGATDPAQITNDVPMLTTGAARRWGTLRPQGPVSHRESGTLPWAGYATLVGGIKVISHAGVTAGTRAIIQRERPGATGGMGHLYSTVADNIVGTSFKVVSSDSTDTSPFYWRIYDPD